MRLLISAILLATGAICVGAGIAEAVRAEHQQRSLSREWHSVTSVEERSSRHQLPAGVVARMVFDRVEREVYVLSDENPANLKKGPVWLRVTSGFPVRGNTVIAGHRDTHFRFLKDVRVGDKFTVEDGVSQTLYRIDRIQIVSPRDRSLLAPVREKVMTLVTCYPFNAVGPAKKRMIVRAELVSRLSTLVSTN